jgi:hypothetical protein
MESTNELYKQLKKLVTTISQCNFISLEDKKDIIQDTMVSLFDKFKEGKITDNFDDIKGYSFMALRNKCVVFRNKHKPQYTSVPIEEIGNTVEIDLDKEDHNLYLHKLITHYLQHDKYSKLQKETCMLLLDNKKNKEIAEELNISQKDVALIKYNIKSRLKVDSKRKILYLIKNKNNKNIQYPCYTSQDTKYYFKDKFTGRQIGRMIYDGFVSEDGYYIERTKEKKIN